MENLDFVLNTFIETYDTIINLNTANGEMVFIKNEKDKINTEKIYNISDFTKHILETDVVHEEDIGCFAVFTDLEKLRRRCATQENGILFTYRHSYGTDIIWSKFIVSIPKSFYGGDPHILLYRRDMSQLEADYEETLNSFNHRVVRELKYNFRTKEARIIKQRSSEAFLRQKYSNNNIIDSSWLVDEGMIHPEDLDTFASFTDFEVLDEYFDSGEDRIFFYYRRKVGNFFKWIRLTITRSTEYTKENPLYTYLAEDVHQILTNLFLKQGMFQYLQFSDKSVALADPYQDNLLKVLSYFTARYANFYMLDLQKNVYLTYKLKSATLTGDIPPFGSYDTICDPPVLTASANAATKALGQYPAAKDLLKLLKNKSSIEFTFTKNGQNFKTSCTKMESENGKPTKVICCTTPLTDRSQVKVETFGNFNVYDDDGSPIKFTKKQSKQLFAYLIDKHGYPVSTKDVILDVLEKDEDDLNALKYVSTLTRLLIKDLEKAGYTGIVVKEWTTLRIQTDRIDCDYYHLIEGDTSYWHKYHNEYMMEYSWAEETNAEILNLYGM